MNMIYEIDYFPNVIQNNTIRVRALEEQLVNEIENLLPINWQPEPDLIEQAKQLINSPLFICGTMKSGSTMLVELLDSHPNLVVLPGDTHFISSIKRNP